MSTDAELRAAIDSAEAAFPHWRDAGVLKRQQAMFRYVNLIRLHWDRLAASITLEQGKTLVCYVGYRSLRQLVGSQHRLPVTCSQLLKIWRPEAIRNLWVWLLQYVLSI